MTTSQGRDARGGGRPGTRRFSGRRRRQCVCKEVGTVGYKDVSVLRRFISDRGRIESGRKAGNCAKCQRELSTAISRARFMALLPYAPNHTRVTGSISPSAASSEDDEADSESEDTDDQDEMDETEDSAEDSDESEDTSDDVESSEADESEDDSDDADDSDQEDDSEDEEKE